LGGEKERTNVGKESPPRTVLEERIHEGAIV